LKKEFRDEPKIFNVISDTDNLTLLVYYLVRGEDRLVSFDKLLEALGQSENQLPLKQDNVAE